MCSQLDLDVRYQQIVGAANDMPTLIPHCFCFSLCLPTVLYDKSHWRCMTFRGYDAPLQMSQPELRKWAQAQNLWKMVNDVERKKSELEPTSSQRFTVQRRRKDWSYYHMKWLWHDYEMIMTWLYVIWYDYEMIIELSPCDSSHTLTGRREQSLSQGTRCTNQKW